MSGSTIRIAHVDDNKDDAFLLRRAIRKENPNAEVEIFHQTEEFISNYDPQKYDMVVLDHNVTPTTTGIDLRKRLIEKTHPERNPCFVLLTGRYEEEIPELKDERELFNHYVQKEVSFGTVAKSILLGYQPRIGI